MNRSLKFLNLYGNCEVIKMEYQNMTNEMTNEQIKRRIEWIDRELQAILEARIEK